MIDHRRLHYVSAGSEPMTRVSYNRCLHLVPRLRERNAINWSHLNIEIAIKFSYCTILEKNLRDAQARAEHLSCEGELLIRRIDNEFRSITAFSPLISEEIGNLLNIVKAPEFPVWV